MEMTLRVFLNGKFRYFNTPDEVIAEFTPDEIRESEISFVVGGEIMGRMESDRLALSAEAKIAGEKILNALTSEDGQIVHKGFTREQLDQAFDLVCNPDDWKDVIDAHVSEGMVEVTVAAIEFFTATEVLVTPDLDAVHVYSVGYRKGPAGP